MRKLIIACVGAALAYALAAVTNYSALAQGDSAPNSYVKLQAATPGTEQTGHVNITGTAIAGQFQGGGAGLTGVNADLLDGLNSTAFLQSIPVPLTLSGNSPTHIIRGENANTTSGSSGVYGLTTSASGTGHTYGVFGESANIFGYGVFGLGPSYGVYGESSGSSGRGVSGVATSASGGIAIGVRGQSDSSSGFGVFGYATATSGNTRGVTGQSSSPSGYGVYGIATANGGIDTVGVFGWSQYGAGVFGDATGTTGVNNGVSGQSSSASGRGVYGHALATTGTNYGVWGETESTNGRGVQGTANAATGTPYGVRGFCSTLNTGYAVYAAGDLGCSGTKMFVIDHPFDPENKYLKHYCTEGPEPLNVYTGNVVTDANGVAWVELPNYFAEINKDFRYTLTVVDDTDSAEFVQAKVARKIRDNHFKIRTSAPKVEVTWRVEAVRNDLWVRTRGAPVEVQKDEAERGKYQHPELYGQPKERGIDYQPEVIRSRK